MNRHDERQKAAERIAGGMGPFQFEWGPGRTLSITRGIMIAVLRRALDKGLIAEAPAEPRAALARDMAEARRAFPKMTAWLDEEHPGWDAPTAPTSRERP